jgi:hypothetical protein
MFILQKLKIKSSMLKGGLENTTLDILPIYIQTIQYNNVRDSVNYSKSNNTTGWQEKVEIILDVVLIHIT